MSDQAHDRVLSGRVAVVTGAGRGIGRATAHQLAALGASVVVNDLGYDGGQPTAQETVDELREQGYQAVASVASVAEWDQAAGIVATALEEFGRLDILVNNAGLGLASSVLDIDNATFDRVVASHVHGTFNCIRHALPVMHDQRHGRIVNIVSRAGLVGMPRTVAYAAAKGGVFGLTNALACDVEGSGVTVNAVAPAATRTSMVTEAAAALDEQGDEGSARAQRLLEAMQSPEHVAVAISSICLPSMSDVNGRTLLVDHRRVAVFEPLATGTGVERERDWTAGELARELGSLRFPASVDPYA